MPFKSKAQLRFMFAKHPRIAREWVKKYGVPKNLPEYKSPRRSHPFSVDPDNKNRCIICGRPAKEHDIA